MIKNLALLAGMAMLVLATTHQDKRFSQYRTIEAYEIRPDIQMTPYYSTEGEVCKIVLEKRHYMPPAIDLRNMSRKQIDQLVDELAPKSDRGKSASGARDEEYTTVEGVAESTILEYENVSIQMYRNATDKQNKGYPVALIEWKKRKCR